ncbi:hypothetical protein CC85DRAFT_111565 [Cutaneotrichosporon oleaginosum]|uniref:Uncharacterized protein n=1 Tax=Cutaneotrichosporon oleaginosum TaxID=879819 RepID=A0A0J1BC72_9TREE|nr:uncharacterized protein CC85DRAFT_111565 [Cutaneotrichosporon oleaginosum]KLT45619.1 hypothetical protein CC85DRAFT_111565 [Cutaneotrichosporon oleaginosum]TXT04585.1 hypothetical protein COLE_07404 [Cutaneotrichosporon oleaginosum]
MTMHESPRNCQRLRVAWRRQSPYLRFRHVCWQSYSPWHERNIAKVQRVRRTRPERRLGCGRTDASRSHATTVTAFTNARLLVLGSVPIPQQSAIGSGVDCACFPATQGSPRHPPSLIRWRRCPANGSLAHPTRLPSRRDLAAGSWQLAAYLVPS